MAIGKNGRRQMYVGGNDRVRLSKGVSTLEIWHVTTLWTSQVVDRKASMVCYTEPMLRAHRTGCWRLFPWTICCCCLPVVLLSKSLALDIEKGGSTFWAAPMRVSQLAGAAGWCQGLLCPPFMALPCGKGRLGFWIASIEGFPLLSSPTG